MTTTYPQRCILSVVIILGLMALATVGCQTSSPKKKDPFFEKWKVTAEQSRGYSPAPRKRSIKSEDTAKITISPALDAETGQHELPQQMISLKMHNTEVSVLLRALARAAGQDIIINEGLAGRVNIDVDKAPWEQVFLSILQAQGLSYEIDGNILRIVTLEDRNQNLKKLETEKKIRAKKRELELTDRLITQVIKIDYANAAQLRANLERFLTKEAEEKPIGSVLVDEHTNSLIISAIPDDLRRMIPLIEELDRPTPQVQIESHIVQSTKAATREIGVRWGGLSEQGNYFVVPDASNASGLTPGLIGSPTVAESAASGFMVNLPATGVAAGTGNQRGLAIGIIGQQGSDILQLQLEALETQALLNILSSPSITTQDNQVAMIEAGTQIPFQTVEDKEVKIEYKDAVLRLEVTPHIIEGKTLKLNIKVTKDQPDFSREVRGQPTIITRRAETNVIVFDGQTTVIGGLIEETKANGEEGVPGLKEIPLLGWLFKGTATEQDKQELLIFITPRILPVRDMR